MSSLIEVIFLLLLFFMLTTSLTRTGVLTLTAAQAGGQPATAEAPLFLRLGPDHLSLNGEALALEDIPARIREIAPEGARLLVSLAPGVTSQRLADLLVLLRRLPDAQVQVLG